MQTDLSTLKADHEKTKGLAARAVTLGAQNQGPLKNLEERVTNLKKGEPCGIA